MRLRCYHLAPCPGFLLGFARLHHLYLVLDHLYCLYPSLVDLRLLNVKNHQQLAQLPRLRLRQPCLSIYRLLVVKLLCGATFVNSQGKAARGQ